MSVTVIESTQVDDTSPNVTYAGAEWTVHTNVQSIFHLYNNTDTFTDRQGATATLTFYGNAVEYWGNQGPYHGPCDVSVDGYQVATVNSHATVDDDPILLWSSSGPNGRNLDLGMHTLEVKVKDPAYPNVCEIDRFVVNVTRSTGGGGSSGGGYSATVAGSGGGGGGGGSTNPPTGKSGPPIAAIAGAVGGAAVLALLLLAWWWLARRRKQKERRAQEIDAMDDKITTVPALAPGHATTPGRSEKPGFGAGGGRPGDRTSTVLGTPVSTPPPSTASYTQHHLAAGFDARATSPPASTVSGHYLNPHASPQPTPRPMSVVSSTSGAPTMSQYSSGPFTSETGTFPIPGFVPHQHQQFAPQTVHTSVQHDVPQQQQHPFVEEVQNPVWAVPLGSQSRPLSPASSSQPTTIDASTQSSAYPPEKAQYRSTAAYPPEKARYAGSALSSTSGAGGSGSNAAPASGSGPSIAAPANNAQDIMNPAVPEAPPPAYS